MDTNWLDLTVVLTWVVGLGAPYLVGILFAWLAENFPAWHKFPTQVKFIVPMVVSLGLAAGAHYLLVNPDFIENVSPTWTLLMQWIITYLGTQKGYMVSKRSGYGWSAQVKVNPKLDEDIPL